MSLIVSYDDVQQMGTDSGGDIIFYYQRSPFTGTIQEVVNGVIIGQSEFTDGHVGGLQSFYYPSGLLHEQYTIRYNKLEGKYTIWDESGNITSQTNWQDGIQVK